MLISQVRAGRLESQLEEARLCAQFDEELANKTGSPLVGKLVSFATFRVKPNILLSKGVGEQVRSMSVSCNSIFQPGNHDMLAFSISSKFVEKKFLPRCLHVFDVINDDDPPRARIVLSTCTSFFHSNPYGI